MSQKTTNNAQDYSGIDEEDIWTPSSKLLMIVEAGIAALWLCLYLTTTYHPSYNSHSYSDVEESVVGEVVEAEVDVEEAAPLALLGYYSVDGKLDGTYPYAMDIDIDTDGNVSGTYYASDSRQNQAGTIQGQLIDDTLTLQVYTHGQVTRTFIGLVNSDEYNGDFVSGYDGARRKFKSTIR